jgi:hypothetical protein
MGPPILTPIHRLDDGSAVRLRLARRSDQEGVAELLARHGVAADALDVRRLLTFDARHRAVLCACALVDGRETVVGVAAAHLDGEAEVDTLVADPGLAELLADALRAQVQARARRAA